MQSVICSHSFPFHFNLSSHMHIRAPRESPWSWPWPSNPLSHQSLCPGNNKLCIGVGSGCSGPVLLFNQCACFSGVLTDVAPWLMLPGGKSNVAKAFFLIGHLFSSVLFQFNHRHFRTCRLTKQKSLRSSCRSGIMGCFFLTLNYASLLMPFIFPLRKEQIGLG